jgi:copper chaperone CopZ
MEKRTFHIPKISCGHCTRTIANELQELKGVTKVSGDPMSKSVTVQWNAPATLDTISAVLMEINYPADRVSE